MALASREADFSLVGFIQLLGFDGSSVLTSEVVSLIKKKKNPRTLRDLVAIGRYRDQVGKKCVENEQLYMDW